MHGKKRAEYKSRLQDPKTAAVLGQKAQQWHALMKELNHRRYDEDTVNDDDNHYDDSFANVTLSLLEKALMVNPDPLHLWNHRREILIRQEEMKQQSKQRQQKDPQTTGDDTGDNGTSPTEVASSSSSPSLLLLLDTELPLTQASLQRNPKAYGAWLHRKWVIQYVHPPTTTLQSELILTTQFLSLDERNFHCWNYRRFIVGCLATATATAASEPSQPSSSVSLSSVGWTGSWSVPYGKNNDVVMNNDPPHPVTGDTTTINNCIIKEWMGPQVVPVRTLSTENDDDNHDVAVATTTTIPIDLIRSEFEFTTIKIKDNFSNFSAFHYRCQLLDVLLTSIANSEDDDGSNNSNSHEQQQSQVDEFIDHEFQLMEDAFCTEPDDQTAWWYHSILLDKILEQQNNNKSGWMYTRERFQSRLEEQAELLRELLEESPGKWVMLGLIRVLEIRMDGITTTTTTTTTVGGDVGDDEDVSILQEERSTLLNRLIDVDPDRGQRYKSMIKQTL